MIGLILLIPIVGSINGTGWMLASLDRLRSGDETLAPANLGYLGRGMRLFIVQLIYDAGIALVALVVYAAGLALGVREGHGSANAMLITVAVLLYVIGFGIATVGGLAVTFATPAIVLATDRGGVGGGLQIGSVWRQCRVNATNTLIAGLMLIAASFIGSVGLIACGIGVLFTTAYALAMQAWIVRSFEMGSSAATAA